MISKADRFWITLVLRFAFGSLFLIASINQFNGGGPHDFGPDWFARNLSKSFESTWVGDLLPMINNPFRPGAPELKKADAQEAKPAPAPGAAAPTTAAAAPARPDDFVHPTYVFLFLLPFIFAALSAPILTGIWLKPAQRMGALLLVMLGVGKYISDGTDLSTTANDFFFAFLICVGLAFIGQGESEAAKRSASAG